MESNALPPTPEIEEAARAWAIRVDDAGFADWDGFTAWLEASPAHLTAYETALAQVEHAAALLAAAPKPAWQPGDGSEVRAPRRRWFPAAAAIAAAVAAVASWGLIDRGSPAEQIATAPGERRAIELADGSRIILNGGTRVTLDRDTPRHVELAQGEALFEVKHDERNPFVVVTGETRLLDAGTVFNVVADGGALDVEVAEGAVIYQPGANQVRLDAGDALSRSRAGAVVLRKASPQDVGGWQQGALHYAGASLDRIARDLARNLGRPVRVAEGTASLQPFNGTLVLKGEPGEVLKRAGPLLGVRFTADGEGWVMSPANGPPR
ncbi:FecR domain-containing protein [Sphingomonas sp. BT-65]|uniref:FecR family protein n=1 Tax=Sphingomonas sp. BT-65 TaxID=2989821 RepID=UPI0022366402|nr:FecR domain-containing protein [Sphingomonas sp. BT-65]MCW4461042.1 FecR domain-containing protein [Sphingomonas sp. BT-65]